MDTSTKAQIGTLLPPEPAKWFLEVVQPIYRQTSRRPCSWIEGPCLG